MVQRILIIIIKFNVDYGLEITNYNRWYKQNEDLKIINIIRPNIIEEVVGAYKKAISE